MRQEDERGWASEEELLTQLKGSNARDRTPMFWRPM